MKGIHGDFTGKRKPRKGKHKRPNPTKKPESMSSMVGDIVGTMAVSQSLVGCTIEEKLLVTALIPTLVKIIRVTIPKDKLGEAVDKMYQPPEEETKQ